MDEPSLTITPDGALVTALRFSSRIRLEIGGGASPPLELNLERPFDLITGAEHRTVDMEQQAGLQDLVRCSLHSEVRAIRMSPNGTIEVEMDRSTLRCEGGDDYEAWELVRGDRDQTYIGGIGRTLVIFDTPPTIISDPSGLPGMDL